MPGSVPAARQERQPLKDGLPPPETRHMPQRELRVVLEWLGLIEPDRSRREPVALPPWAPWVATLFLVSAAALGAVVVRALLGLPA
jgi:hypothetical protein